MHTALPSRPPQRPAPAACQRAGLLHLPQRPRPNSRNHTNFQTARSRSRRVGHCPPPASTLSPAQLTHRQPGAPARLAAVQHHTAAPIAGAAVPASSTCPAVLQGIRPSSARSLTAFAALSLPQRPHAGTQLQSAAASDHRYTVAHRGTTTPKVPAAGSGRRPATATGQPAPLLRVAGRAEARRSCPAQGCWGVIPRLRRAPRLGARDLYRELLLPLLKEVHHHLREPQAPELERPAQRAAHRPARSDACSRGRLWTTPLLSPGAGGQLRQAHARRAHLRLIVDSQHDLGAPGILQRLHAGSAMVSSALMQGPQDISRRPASNQSQPRRQVLEPLVAGWQCACPCAPGVGAVRAQHIARLVLGRTRPAPQSGGLS